MARIDKAGIYIDAQKLFEVLYNAQFEMPKRDRCVLAPRALDHCEKFMAEFSLAYSQEEDKKQHINNMLAEYEMLKTCCRFMTDNRLIKTESNIKQIREYIVRINEGVVKWQAYVKSLGKQPVLNG